MKVKLYNTLQLATKCQTLKGSSNHERQLQAIRTLCTHSRINQRSETAEPETNPASSIPGVKDWPLVGSLPGMIRHGGAASLDGRKLHLVIRSLFKSLGPVYKLRFPGEGTFVFFKEPDTGEELYKKTTQNPVRDAFHSLKKIRSEHPNNFFEKKTGILTENHEEWRRVRSRVQPPMLKIKNIVKYLPQMDQVAIEFVQRIENLQEENGGECPENFLEELYKWSLESISLVALDRRLGCFDNSPMTQTIIESVNKMFGALTDTEIGTQWWKLFPTGPYKTLQKAHEVLLEITLESIEKTEKLISETSTDDQSLTLIQTLLRTPGLERRDVVTMILDTLFAGVDTTSHTVGFLLYLLARNPEKQAILQQELDSVLQDGEPITEAHLAKLSYLKACFKESLRFFPLTLGTARTLQEDTVIGGYKLPKGYTALVCTAMSGWDEKHFKNAQEFIPERWGREKPLGPIHPFASLPFSHGPRVCIGRRIAEQEMYTLIARLLHRYTVEYKYEDIELAFRLVAIPSRPLKYKFTERQ